MVKRPDFMVPSAAALAMMAPYSGDMSPKVIIDRAREAMEGTLTQELAVQEAPLLPAPPIDDGADEERLLLDNMRR